MKFNKDKEVKQKLGFKPIPEFDYLCLGALVSVKVEENNAPKIRDDGSESEWEYAGNDIPQLVFTFKNVKHPSEKDNEFFERWYTHRESVIGSVKKDGTPIAQKSLDNFYSQMFDRIKHIRDAYETQPNFKELDDDIPEIDETTNIPSDERLKQFKRFFNFFAKSFNVGKDGKEPIYKGDIPMAMKLVADYSTGKFLAFPTFVKQGFIEPYIKGRRPSIELKPDETVVLKGGKSHEGGNDVAKSAEQEEVEKLLNEQ